MTLPATSSQSGVRTTRRVVLHSALALPAAMLLSRYRAAPELRPPGGFEDFLERWLAESEEFVKQDRPNEDELLHKLCGELAGMDLAAFPEREQVTYENEGLKSGPLGGRIPFIVIQFDLEPGAVIRAHNHVGFSFLSLGVRGEATVKHFEPDGKAPDPGSEINVDFRVREVASTLLTAGRTSTLTRTRANIHAFRAGDKGARFIDFGVKLPDAGEGYKSFSVLDYDEKPVDTKRRIHDARWIGNIYKKSD